jgi:hypothetical protein
LINRQNQILNSLKDELGRLFMISFGVFLFILFFQPFSLENLDYNNRLIFVTGFGAITYLLACIILIVLPLLLPKWVNTSEWESGPPVILILLLLCLNATAFAFYIRYVGGVMLTFYIVFKLLLVCLLPIIILIILYKNKSLESVINEMQEQHRNLILQVQANEKSEFEEEIEFYSENKSDKLSLKSKNIVCIKSADNYVELYYLKDDFLEKKLLRNTLKNIEIQLESRKYFLKCHRTCIVNKNYIKKLVRSYSGYSLTLFCTDEKIPVSRHYLLFVKEALSYNV